MPGRPGTASRAMHGAALLEVHARRPGALRRAGERLPAKIVLTPPPPPSSAPPQSRSSPFCRRRCLRSAHSFPTLRYNTLISKKILRRRRSLFQPDFILWQQNTRNKINALVNTAAARRSGKRRLAEWDRAEFSGTLVKAVDSERAIRLRELTFSLAVKTFVVTLLFSDSCFLCLCWDGRVCSFDLRLKDPSTVPC